MVRVFNHGSLDRSFMVDALSYFSFQCMVHIKEPLLLIGKSRPCGGSRFPVSLSEWSFTICLKPYNRGKSVHSWCNGSSDQSFMVDALS